MLLDKQAHITPRRGMPVERVDESQKLVTITGESVQLYYYNNWVYTIDAWQLSWAAVGKTTYGSILDKIWAQLGSFWNSSLSFTSTAFTTEVAMEEASFEALDYLSPSKKCEEITKNLAVWQYVVDYRYWIIYGVKASWTIDLQATTYKISSNASQVTLETGDIALWAVELKDASSNNRATITAWWSVKVTATEDIPTVITSWNKTVAATWTAESLWAALATKSVYIRAKSSNTWDVYVGDSTVDAVTNQWIILSANDSITLNIANLSTIFVDVAVNAEGVDYVALS